MNKWQSGDESTRVVMTEIEKIVAANGPEPILSHCKIEDALEAILCCLERMEEVLEQKKLECAAILKQICRLERDFNDETKRRRQLEERLDKFSVRTKG